MLSASYVARTHDFDAYVNGIANKSAEESGKNWRTRFDGGNDYQGYYSGITRDSCREVSGREAYSLGEMRTVNSWTDFTTTWRTG
eukprot:scaffold327_cov189-Alexandrium_tamarense.AAC.11